jgi:ABC-type transport system involved in multi-copper enzyme maturation permease subunit
MSAAQPEAATAAAHSTTRDFPEWLSPIVVKELRQGMRSRLFVSSFLLLHAAMILIALLALVVAAEQGDARIASWFFWMIVGVPLLVVMPLSGLSSVANERKANSLELIFLTRVTSRRILVGKWLAIVAQTALLVCLVLPYAVLRYFFGGIDVSSDLVTLAALLFASALLSAIAVGLSPQMSPLLRPVLLIGAIVFLQIGWPYLAYGVYGGGGVLRGGAAIDWKVYLGLLMMAALLQLTMFEVGAAKIAPPAANHSTSRRLIGLAAILGCVILGGWLTAKTPLSRVAIALLIPICVGALCEAPSSVASVYRPFVQRGVLGRIAGRLLYPGWPSGVFYCLLVFALFFVPASVAARGVHEAGWIWWIGTAVIGALLLPAAVNQTFFARYKRPLTVYVAVQAFCVLLVAICSLIESFHGPDVRAIAATVPTSGLLLANGRALSDNDLPLLLSGTSALTLGSLVLLLLKMRQPWREIRRVEHAASAALATSLSDASEPRAAH